MEEECLSCLRSFLEIVRKVNRTIHLVNNHSIFMNDFLYTASIAKDALVSSFLCAFATSRTKFLNAPKIA